MENRIVLGVVDIAHKEDARAVLKEIASVCPGAEVHITYVMPYGFFSYVEPFVSDDSIKAAGERAKQELAELATSAGLVEAKRHVMRGGIGDQIILLAKELKADLLVINATRHDSSHQTLGTHAAQVARHAPCSVMLVRA